MRIALDVRSIDSQKTGKEWYTFSLLHRLVEIDSKNEYYLYSRYDFSLEGFPDNCVKRVIRVPMWWWHIAVLIDMLKNNVRIYLATASYIIASMLFSKRIHTIVTVHDLVAFLQPDKHHRKALIIERLTARLAFRNASKIICPSINTQTDLEKRFPSTRSKTAYIPEAARKNFTLLDKNDCKREIILSKYGFPKKYILYIGTLAPRKNLVRLLKAYFRLPPEVKALYSLVLVGKKGWYYKEIFDTVQKLNLEHNVFFAGYVDDFDLPYILEQATCFVYPSLYEGFGLPLLEAMACGVPVVSSDTAALLEVAEGVAEIVDCFDEDSMRRGLEKVLLNASYRDELVTKGLKRSAEFSWKKAARETLDLIDQISHI